MSWIISNLSNSGEGEGFIGCVKSQSDFLTLSIYSSFSRSSNILVAPPKSLEEAGLLSMANYEPLRNPQDKKNPFSFKQLRIGVEILQN